MKVTTLLNPEILKLLRANHADHPTQFDVEKAARLKRGQLAQYEKGIAEAPLKSASLLAHFYGVSLKEIVAWDELIESRIFLSLIQEIVSGSEQVLEQPNGHQKQSE